MFRSDAGKTSDEFVDARIVLHGTGTEWIHAQVDGVIPGGKTREVAEDFDFADFWKPFRAGFAMVLAQRFLRINGGNIEAWKIEGALAGRGMLEDQPFILADMARNFIDVFVLHKSEGGEELRPGQFLLS